MHKLNCWEAMECGRQPGGPRAALLGVCPACNEKSADGVNGGTNGGRICWAVSGTLCGGKVCGSYAEKRLTCLNCEFYKQVAAGEGLGFQILVPGQPYHHPQPHPAPSQVSQR